MKVRKSKRDCLDLIEKKGLKLTIQKIGGVERLIGPSGSVAVPITSWDKLYAGLEVMPGKVQPKIEYISLIGKSSAEREQIALKIMADYQAQQERKGQRDTEIQSGYAEEKPPEHAEEN